MSRLYLTFLLSLVCLGASGQNYLKKYLDFAQEQYNKGDYFYAAEYYRKAMQIDSNTVEILWNYAETLRAYKDYRNAEYYYAKVYDREEAAMYPYSLLYWGLMQKQNGKYEQALETFKKAKKKYYKDKKGYLYQKAKREVESIVWVLSALRDTTINVQERLPETVNTKNSEFGHGIYDKILYFSSLRADSISAAEEVYENSYHTHLFSSQKKEVGFEEGEQLNDLFREKINSGNGSFSLDRTRFYFSDCSEDGYNYSCKIMVASYNDGKWSFIDSLGEIINEPGTNTTMPCIGEIDGREVLFFASNREDSKGGLDIYYSAIRNGNQYEKVRPVKAANSMDNDVTPWWDQENKRLYFASSWHNGFGGYDVFYTEYKNGFEAPVNVGLPMNSPANDLYFFREADTLYITSNRIGVLYSKNPTCCSDIFAFKPPKIVVPPTKEETLVDLMKRLPVTLYFHNDIPDPRSWDTLTSVNYIESYNDYTAMIDRYKKEYSTGLSGNRAEEAKEDIESFFVEYVDKGVADLVLFRDLLLKELDRGAKIRITVKGFASPLAKTEYNVNLTKRRINSLINYMRAYDNGIFAKYLDGVAKNGGKVEFAQVPFGEYTANQLTSDNPNDVKNSVYSRAAAIERKIEIQSVSYMEEDREFPLIVTKEVIDLGIHSEPKELKATFELKNKSDSTVRIERITSGCDCLQHALSSSLLAPGESAQIIITLNTETLKGHNVQELEVVLEGIEETLKLYVSTEIK